MASTSISPSSPTITQRTQASELTACATTLKAAFADDPFLRFTLTPDPRKKNQARATTSLINNETVMTLLFDTIIGASRAVNGTFSSISRTPHSSTAEAGGPYPAVGILIGPGRNPENPVNYLHQLWRVTRLLFHCGTHVSWRLLYTFPSEVAALKKRAHVFTDEQIRRRDFYYIFFVGARPEAQGQGLGSAWLRQCQDIARKEGKAIWLESSSAKSRDLYARLGWKVVAEHGFGEGLVDAQGRVVGVEGQGQGQGLEHEAVGTRLWGMVWWPEGLGPDADAGAAGTHTDTAVKQQERSKE